MLNEGNQIHYFICSSGSGTVINYCSGSNFLTSYGSGSGSTSQKVTVPKVPVPVPQRFLGEEGRDQEPHLLPGSGQWRHRPFQNDVLSQVLSVVVPDQDYLAEAHLFTLSCGV